MVQAPSPFMFLLLTSLNLEDNRVSEIIMILAVKSYLETSHVRKCFVLVLWSTKKKKFCPCAEATKNKPTQMGTYLVRAILTPYCDIGLDPLWDLFYFYICCSVFQNYRHSTYPPLLYLLFCLTWICRMLGYQLDLDCKWTGRIFHILAEEWVV